MMDDLEKLGFVTEDEAIKHHRQETKLGAGDHEMLKAAQTGEGLIEIKSEQLMELAKVAAETHSYFQGKTKGMTHDQAKFVRQLRVDQSYSWRAVAEACYEQEWKGWIRWQPPSNQLMGMSLCEKATRFFNEEYMKPPWN